MPFHRLVAATYFGVDGNGLLAGFDKLNDPQNGGPGTGVPTPADAGAKSGGTYDGVYFVAASEPANAFNVNRGLRAVADNTDFLDDLLRRDIAVTVRNEVSSGHGGSSTHNLDGSTDNVYVGSSTLGTPPLIELFSVTDPTGEAPIFVNGSKVVVTGVAPDNRGVGDGFDSTNPITLTFNQTIPDAQAFRVYYGIRRNLATLPENAFTFMDILRATEASATSSGTVVNDTNLTDVALGNIDTKSGGVGNPISTSQEAFDNIDLRLTKLRGFTATISDGTNSFGGDHEAVALDAITNDASSTVKGGIFSVRRGTYDLLLAWDVVSHFVASANAGVVFRVAAAAAGDIVVSGSKLDGIGLDSAAPARRFNIGGDFIVDGGWKGATVGAGCLVLNGISVPHIELRNLSWAANTAITTATSSGLEIAGTGQLSITGCVIDTIPTNAVTKTATMWMHEFIGSTSHAVFEGCRFLSDQSGADAVFLENVQTRTIFRNCRFEAASGSADAWALRATGCSFVVFENCEFIGFEGQCIRAENSSIVFRNCRISSGTGVALANPQTLAGYGINSGGKDIDELRFENCRVSLGSSSTDGSGAPTLPPIELGGIAGTAATSGRTMVDGLEVINDSAAVHNFTMVVLHAHPAESLRNIYRNLTIDANGVTPAATGTLGSVLSSIGSVGPLLEVVGLATQRPATLVENLVLTNVAGPTTNIVRGVMNAQYCTINGLQLEGWTTLNAGNFAESLLSFLSVEVVDIHLMLELAIRCNAGTGVIDSDGEVRISGGRMKMQVVYDRFINMAAYDRLENVIIEMTATPTAAVIGVALYGEVSGCLVTSNTGTTILFVSGGAGADEIRVIGNTLRRTAAGSDILSLLGDRCIVMGNTFITTNATPPTITVSGTGSIGDGTNNVIAGSADTTFPANL